MASNNQENDKLKNTNNHNGNSDNDKSSAEVAAVVETSTESLSTLSNVSNGCVHPGVILNAIADHHLRESVVVVQVSVLDASNNQISNTTATV